MGKVVTFDTCETSAIDTDPIQRLKRELGEKQCRVIVDGLIFEITDILCRIEKHIARREYDSVGPYLDRLMELSGHLGLVCITDVAGDLKDCLDQDDLASIAAVSARIVRLGEDSLFSLIEFTNRSIV